MNCTQMKMSFETNKNSCFTMMLIFKILNGQNVGDYF